jgi:hypothetical protein
LVLAVQIVALLIHITPKQTGLILFLVRLPQLVAVLVLAVDLLALLRVTAALAAALVVILVDLLTAQALPVKVLPEDFALTLQNQKAAAAAVEQVKSE